MDISIYRKQIAGACRLYEVESLYVFGSVLTNRFSNESDLDFVVSFRTTDPLLYTENYFGLKFFLEELFDREIDLLEEKTIHNQYLKASIEASKELIYAA